MPINYVLVFVICLYNVFHLFVAKRAYFGGGGVITGSSALFLNHAADAVSRSSRQFIPEIRVASTHWIGGRMGHRFVWILEKRKSIPFARKQTIRQLPSPQATGHPTVDIATVSYPARSLLTIRLLTLQLSVIQPAAYWPSDCWHCNCQLSSPQPTDHSTVAIATMFQPLMWFTPTAHARCLPSVKLQYRRNSEFSASICYNK